MRTRMRSHTLSHALTRSHALSHALTRSHTLSHALARHALTRSHTPHAHLHMAACTHGTRHVPCARAHMPIIRTWQHFATWGAWHMLATWGGHNMLLHALHAHMPHRHGSMHTWQHMPRATYYGPFAHGTYTYAHLHMAPPGTWQHVTCAHGNMATCQRATCTFTCTYAHSHTAHATCAWHMVTCHMAHAHHLRMHNIHVARMATRTCTHEWHMPHARMAHATCTCTHGTCHVHMTHMLRTCYAWHIGTCTWRMAPDKW
jgi:hypothetical protein